MERQICEVWQQVLGIKDLGVHDNFFDLGGNSLVATQVMSRLRRIFEVELCVRALFEAPTVARLAGTVREGTIGQLDSKTVADMVKEIKQLSSEETQRRLARERQAMGPR